MNWITEHWKDLAALFGALYALALIIVKLTPTPKDDAALASVNVVLRTIAKLFGLDLKQGITKKTPLFWFMATTLLLSSCSTIDGIKSDPAKQYQLSAAVFTESVTVLTALRKAGKIDPDEAVAISRVIHMGQTILNTWSTALKDGRDYPGVEHMAPILLQLQQFASIGGQP